MSVFGEIYTTGKKFYTPAMSDVSDKFHLWLSATKLIALGHQKENRINFFPSENDLPFPFFHKTSKVNLYEKLHFLKNRDPCPTKGTETKQGAKEQQNERWEMKLPFTPQTAGYCWINFES